MSDTFIPKVRLTRGKIIKTSFNQTFTGIRVLKIEYLPSSHCVFYLKFEESKG